MHRYGNTYNIFDSKMVERMTAYESSLIQEKDYVGIQGLHYA